MLDFLVSPICVLSGVYSLPLMSIIRKSYPLQWRSTTISFVRNTFRNTTRHTTTRSPFCLLWCLVPLLWLPLHLSFLTFRVYLRIPRPSILGSRVNNLLPLSSPMRSYGPCTRTWSLWLVSNRNCFTQLKKNSTEINRFFIVTILFVKY